MNRLTSAFGDWMAAKVKKDKTPLVKCQTIDAARSANVKKKHVVVLPTGAVVFLGVSAIKELVV